MSGRSHETEHVSHSYLEAHPRPSNGVGVTYKVEVRSSVCGLCGTGDLQAAVASWGRRPRGPGS